MEILRLIGPLLLAVITTGWIDFAIARRGLLPPFHRMGLGSEAGSALAPGSVYRRSLAAVGLSVVLWIGVFGPLGSIGQEVSVDFDTVPTARLFHLHAIFALFVVGWYVAGFVPRRRLDPHRAQPGWSFASQLGFQPSSRATVRGSLWRDAGQEIGVGFLFGIVGWLAVLTVLLLIGSLIWILGGEEALPSDPPEMIAWVAALPWVVRLGISLSAGVVEETFFRGLLQPRCGILLSTVLFVLAHAGYEQPLMLVGVTLLSLFFSALVVWRQSILAAITAHAVFDAVQLLIVIPSIMKLLGGSDPASGWLASIARIGVAWVGGRC